MLRPSTVPETPRHHSSSDQSAALAQTATAQGSDSLPPGVGPALSKGEGLGRYTILETLGSGGMGVVYGAYDPDLDRKVALKLLRSQDGAHGTATGADRARLLREARAMAKLSCPNVITVFEVGTVAERDFVAMEFVDGMTLAQWIKEPRDWRDVVEMFRMAGEGLISAHDVGLIHRDFKPANVLIRNDGRVIVTDFGLARLADDTVEFAGPGATGSLSDGSNSDQLTRTGAVLGTPAYMAPEQHKNDPADERSDQFAFSVALYEALYGERPFKGATFEELRDATLAAEIPPEPKGSSVPAWLRAVVLRGLSPDPAERYASVAEMLRALNRKETTQRRWWMVAVAVVAIAAVLGVYLVRRDSKAKSDQFEKGKRAAQAQQCADTERTFSGVWDDNKKKLLQSAFVKASAEAAAATYQGFVRVLDRYKQQWSTIYKTTCEATRVEHKRTEADFHLHMGCLLQRRDQFKSLIEVFMRADAQVAGRAVQAAHNLPRLDDCSDLQLLRSGLVPPKDPRTRQSVEQVRKLLAEAHALQQALRLKEGIAMAAKAVELAKKSGYKPVTAEALFRLGTLYFHYEETSSSRKTLKEAAFAAAVSEHKEYQARVAVAQIQLEAKFSSRNARTRKQAQLAAAIVKRYGRDEVLHARLDSALGRLSIDDGNYDDAQMRFDRAYATLRRVLGANNLRTVGVLQRLAEVTQLKGNVGRALSLHQNALSLLETQLGKDHARVASALESVAVRLRMTGRYDEARRLFARARRYWESEAGQRAMSAFGLPKRKVKKPRVVSGRVVDGEGKPVANADVALSMVLAGDGKYMHAAQPLGYKYTIGGHRMTTDAAGKFSFAKADGQAMFIGAEGRGGRSWPLLVAKGGARKNLVLKLRPYGRLEGTVTLPGKRPPEFDVFAVAGGPGTHPRAGVGVTVDDKGRFKFERLAVGEYLLFVEFGGEAQGRVYAARKVKVEAGKPTSLSFNVNLSGSNVEVVIGAKDKRDIGTLQLALLDGHVKAKTLDGVRKLFQGSVTQSKGRVGNTKRLGMTTSQHFKFSNLRAGKYTVCTVVLGGDMKDPEFALKLRENQDGVTVQCDPVVVTKTTKRIDVSLPDKKN